MILSLPNADEAEEVLERLMLYGICTNILFLAHGRYQSMAVAEKVANRLPHVDTVFETHGAIVRHMGNTLMALASEGEDCDKHPGRTWNVCVAIREGLSDKVWDYLLAEDKKKR